MQQDQMTDGIFSNFFYLFSNCLNKTQPPQKPLKDFQTRKMSFLTIKLQILCWKNILTHLSPSADIHTASPSPPRSLTPIKGARQQKQPQRKDLHS